MLGGGTYTSFNKVVPGVYINTKTEAKGYEEAERGIVAYPAAWNWGPNEVVVVNAADAIEVSKKVFGYSYTEDEMKPIREIFEAGASKIAFYRLTGGEKASSTFATAKYSGERGNAIKNVVEASIDEEGKFNVYTYLNGVQVDKQTVATYEELKANDYVVFDKTGVTLSAVAGVTLSGGTTAELTVEDYDGFMDKIAAYTFNVICLTTTDETVKSAFIAYVKSLRNDKGVKVQLVLGNKSANHEAVISVGAKQLNTIPWVAGAMAGVEVGDSLTNKAYTGEEIVDVSYTQREIEEAIKGGTFIFHNVNGAVKVLKDINTLTEFTTDKGKIFANNNTVRTVDAISNDLAKIFGEHVIGITKNNEDGRLIITSYTNDVLSEYIAREAIEDHLEETTVAEVDDESVSVKFPIEIIGTVDKIYVLAVIE